MSWLLNLVYLALLTAYAPLLAVRLLKRTKRRSALASRLLGLAPRLDARDRIWFHAVSVGELQLLKPLLQWIRSERPELDIVISSTTETGLALARRQYTEHTVFPFPLDFSWAVHRVLRHVRPSLVVLVELELWPNLITAASRQGIPVAVINGRLSEKSAAGYRYLRPLLASMLNRIAWIGCQDAVTADRFRRLGAAEHRLGITGSLKFDGAELDRSNAHTRQLSRLAGFQSTDLVWLVGSTQEPEERIAVELFERLAQEYPQLKLVLVPRHAERFDAVAELAEASQYRSERRTRIDLIEEFDPPRIVVVDTIGELGAWWGTAHIGFVGGSFTRRGGQNMLEPAGYGVATCFGPNTHNFRDIVELLTRADACRVVTDAGELERFVRQCLQDPNYRQQLGERARRVVADHRGATPVTGVKLLELLGGPAREEACRHGVVGMVPAQVPDPVSQRRSA